MSLLDHVRTHFSQEIRAWNNFSNPGGDVSYFADLQDRMAQHALSKIEQSFEKIVELEHKMTRMESTCGNIRKIVSTALRGTASFNSKTAFTPYEFNTYRFESGEQPKKRQNDGS
jgi:hypothetical protein